MGAGASQRQSVGSRSESRSSTRSSPKVLTPSYSTTMASLHDNIIGDGVVFSSSFGEKRVLYLDYTASGRPVKYIEDYMTREVYPKYANTHTSTCVTARQTGLLREGARSYIKKCVNANDDDVLLFTGAGVTGAIHKLVSALDIKASETVVLIGPYEHHSNILPWKESGAKVHTISQTQSGQIDLKDLEDRIIGSAGKTVIGSFSAASNVTGILSDVKRVTRLLKRYGALAFWDYATAAPYVNIDMNSTQQGAIDAVFISPHKFLGGPQSPGILVAKKHLFRNKVPVVPGGGTVAYVYSEGHEYLTDIEAREEGGTPPIMESIRAALAFKLKHSVGMRRLHDREEYLYKVGKDYWTQNSHNMTILGCGSVHRLPIFSFIVTHPTLPKLVHHNFISTLLNDLYGIQTRGGCACAGPYGESLLGINAQHFLKFFRNKELAKKPNCYCEGGEHCDHTLQEVLKPGFCRLNLPFTINEDELDFILQAVKDVTDSGWKLLPLYTFDAHSGSWKTKKKAAEELHHFEDLTLLPEGLHYNGSTANTPTVKPLTKDYLQDTLSEARELMASVPARLLDETDSDYDSLHGDSLPSGEDSIWFVTPEEAEDTLQGQTTSSDREFIQRKVSPHTSTVPAKTSSSPDGRMRAFNPRAMTAKVSQRRQIVDSSLADVQV